jgi:hypothetical protein
MSVRSGIERLFYRQGSCLGSVRAVKLHVASLGEDRYWTSKGDIGTGRRSPSACAYVTFASPVICLPLKTLRAVSLL